MLVNTGAAALCLALHLTVAAAQICDPKMYTGLGASDNPIPKLPKTFYASIEANIVDQGFTVETRELVDQENNMIKIEETATPDKQTGSVTTIEIFDFKNNQVATYARFPNTSYGTCSVTDLTKAGDRYLFGQLSSDNSGNRFFTSQAAFGLTDQFPVNYIGSTTIRGIKVDQWENCINLPDPKATVKASWYFSSATNWNTAAGIAQVPVSLNIVGTVTDPNGVVRNINHSYEFVHFRTKIPEAIRSSGYQVPFYAVCPGQKTGKTVPKIPNTFSFTTEVVIPGIGVVTAIREYYDSQMMTSRFDYVQGDGDNIEEVHDWRSGVAYAINRIYGKCVPQPIQGGSFDSEDVGNGRVRMRTANEFFGLNGDGSNFQFIGQRNIRGMPCNVFNTIKTNWPPGTGEDSLSIWEIAFSQPAIQMTGGPVDLEQEEPVQLSIIHLNNQNLSQIYNIINFDESSPDLDRFDVGVCYEETQKKRVAFILAGSYSAYVENGGRVLFRYLTLLSLMSYTGLLPMRISRLQLGRDGSDNIVVSFMILDPPPTSISDLCDDCPKTKVNVPTEDAIALLRDAIDSNKFVVKADTDNVNDLQTVFAKPKTLSLDGKTRTEVVTSQVVTLDAGSASGIAIGLFAVGCILTLLSMFLLVKFRGSNLPPFMAVFTAKN